MSELSNREDHYRLVLACDGVPVSSGPQAAVDITQEFTKRPWHDCVVCTWDGHALVLQVENDFDPEGIALIDEFSDAIAASVAGGFEGNIRVLSTARF
jgi:hypothetical protein